MKSLAVAGQIYTLSSGGFTMKIDLRLLFLVLLTTSQLKELTLTVLTWRSPTVICDYVGEAPPQGKENGGTARLAERVRWLTVLPRCLTLHFWFTRTGARPWPMLPSPIGPSPPRL